MVEYAIPLPVEAAEQVVREHQNPTPQAVRDVLGDAETDRLRREAVDGDGDLTVFVGLDSHEVERVEAAADEAGEHPSVWLSEIAETAAMEAGPTPSTPLSEHVERSILQETET